MKLCILSLSVSHVITAKMKLAVGYDYAISLHCLSSNIFTSTRIVLSTGI